MTHLYNLDSKNGERERFELVVELLRELAEDGRLRRDAARLVEGVLVFGSLRAQGNDSS